MSWWYFFFLIFTNFKGGYDCITTPYQAILKKGVSATFSKGCDIDSQNKSGFEKAISDAKSADVVFLFLGIDETIEVFSIS